MKRLLCLQQREVCLKIIQEEILLPPLGEIIVSFVYREFLTNRFLHGEISSVFNVEHLGNFEPNYIGFSFDKFANYIKQNGTESEYLQLLNLKPFHCIDFKGERNGALYMLAPNKTNTELEFIIGSTDYGWGTPPSVSHAIDELHVNLYEFFDLANLPDNCNSPYQHLTLQPNSDIGRLILSIFDKLKLKYKSTRKKLIGIVPEKNGAIALQFFENTDSSFNIFEDSSFYADESDKKTIRSLELQGNHLLTCILPLRNDLANKMTCDLVLHVDSSSHYVRISYYDKGRRMPCNTPTNLANCA
jgi:hypothetical protein